MGANKSQLRPEVISDLKNTTDFSYTEICDLYRQFRADLGDDKGDLEMTKDDFVKMYRNVFPQGDADKFAEYVFRTFDKQNKGKINFREFITTLSVQLKGNMQTRLEWAFDLYDIHNTGFISRNECKELISSIHNLNAGVLPKEHSITPNQLTEYLFEKAGKTGADATLKRSEFVQVAMTSKTLQALLEGTTVAAGSPFLKRKQRSGSFGKPRSGSFRGDV